MLRQHEGKDYSQAEIAEIYFRALLRGITDTSVLALFCGLVGDSLGTFVAASYYAGTPPIPDCVEGHFTRSEVLFAGLKTGAVTAALSASLCFFPLVKSAIKDGYENGPKSIDPLCTIKAIWNSRSQ